jgi:amidophosphoribosyltransferase
MATMDGNLMHLKKGLGLISQVIASYDLSYLEGNAGIGHVRFPTAGSADDPEQAHPFYVNSPFGIMLAHNGNLTNTVQLRDEMLFRDHRHVRTKSDSEVLTNVFAFELQQQTTGQGIDNQKIFAAIKQLHQRVRGGYAVVSLIANYGLVAFRDPHGIRPLVLGQKIAGDGFITYMLASESCTLNINGFTLVRDVLPGETIIITLEGKLDSQICCEQAELNICIFEYAYLARPDSIMEQVPIQQVRQLMGQKLAQTILKEHSDLEIDAIIPIPEIARTSAIALARELGKSYHEGFVKNHLYNDDRIAYGSSQPLNTSILNRLSTVELEFKDKNVLLVDVSIVRGINSREIVQLAYQAGAKKVFFASCAPRICYSSVYGVDMPSYSNLIAYQRDDEMIAAAIGADRVIYQNLEDLKAVISEINPQLIQFEASCFDGNYITGDINEEYLSQLANGVVH